MVQPEAVQHIESSDEGVTFKAQSYESKEDPTLLHWILAQGNKASLQDILDYCQKGLALVSINYHDIAWLEQRDMEVSWLLQIHCAVEQKIF